MRDLVTRLFRDEFRVAAGNRVEHLLQRVAANRENVAALPPNLGVTFNSMLLNVDRAHGHLVLDELNPAAGNDALGAAASFYCVARADGIYVGFQTRLLDAVEWEGFGALRVAYPDALFQLQRRGFFRVLVSASDVGQVDLHRRGARPLQAQCHDISAGGMRLHFVSPTDYALTEGEYLPQVRFMLGGVELTSEAQVRFVGAVRASTTRQPARSMGIQFLNVRAPFEQRILNYVQRRDRELLRDTRAS